jgi:hypothetical protein
MFELKRLSTSAIPSALVKAERYRLLNEPEEAQSICEDVLHADPANADAVRTLILALTDSFPLQDGKTVSRAQDLVARLPSAACRQATGCAKPCAPSSAPKPSSRPTTTMRC